MEFIDKVQISVIMSVYAEPENWLRMAIDSVLNQTYKEFEFIIINDNPLNPVNDKVLKEYQNKDNRIVLIHNQENIGLTKSLNKGLKFAKGKYIARMDADDISLPQRFQLQYNFMEENQNCLLLGTEMYFIDVDSKLIGDISYPHCFNEIKEELTLKNVLSHPTLFYKKSLVLDYNMFYNETYKYAQDYDFITRVCVIGEVLNLNEKLLKYRKSDIQIGSSKKEEQDKFANKIRRNYITNILEKEYQLSVKNKSKCLFKNLKDIKSDGFIDKALLSSVIYLKHGTFVDRLKLVLGFRYSLVNSCRLILKR